MIWFLVWVLVFSVGGLVSASGRGRAWVGPASAALGGTAIFVQSLGVLLGGRTLSIDLPWSVPLGSLNMALDPLAAVFAAPIALVGALAALYGRQYLAHAPAHRAARSWLAFNLLLASMLLVVVARNGVLFLVAWEVMSLSSFFLVIFDAHEEHVRRAGWIYLVATHLGAALLLAMFALLGRGQATLNFENLAAPQGTASLVFVLALLGFGAKAGLVPLHVWLPEAHPAAPSHVSAVMSGVMIKTGIYGLLRVLTLIGHAEPWWGWTLLAAGAVSGVLGVLFALAQHDLKRLLAYHSVENIGIICLGLGVGLLGIAYDAPAMAVLGLAGALFHVVNHAVFKSLLFLGAGAVQQATLTREMDHLGGLAKRMRTTGRAFLIGSAAIAGLPPLNGFASELLIYAGVLAGLSAAPRPAGIAWPLLAVLSLGGLSLIGGLAAACFTKAYGVVFLGQPRSSRAAQAREAGPAMRGAMLVLAVACVVLAVVAPFVPRVLGPAIATLMPGLPAAALSAGLQWGTRVLAPAAAAALVLVLAVAAAALWRRRLLTGRSVERAVTWDCGYLAPAPRMQYTSSSFAAPLVQLFRIFLGTHTHLEPPAGLFPTGAALHTDTPDPATERFYRPAFAAIGRGAARLRWLQHGRVQLYVLYIALTLLVLLVWKLG